MARALLQVTANYFSGGERGAAKHTANTTAAKKTQDMHKTGGAAGYFGAKKRVS